MAREVNNNRSKLRNSRLQFPLLSTILQHQDQLKSARIKKRRYIELCFKQILQQKGVLNAFVFDENGVPCRTTIEHMETIRHIGLIQEILIKSKRALHTIEHHHQDDFQSLRVRSRKFEILVTKDDDLYFVVYQMAVGKFIDIFI